MVWRGEWWVVDGEWWMVDGRKNLHYVKKGGQASLPDVVLMLLNGGLAESGAGTLFRNSSGMFGIGRNHQLLCRSST